ncbi:hypothetical protein Zmor_012833 [Zophobas morio]|uniref:Rab-GAP TBC domain-containing protein n=1 Tax=Zophobas morio TaxID=2755281 RepID=A0AA38IGB4_9CUCU|nr:hypothetical protein Zmor_012833 [Zophobas morio]
MECDTSSLDEETSSLLNNGSSGDFEKQSELNDFDENEDTRSELKFDRELETEAERTKRAKIEEALSNNNSGLKTWQQLAIDEFGLVGDDLRRKVWPLLLELDPDGVEKTPLWRSCPIIVSTSRWFWTEPVAEEVFRRAFHTSSVWRSGTNSLVIMMSRLRFWWWWGRRWGFSIMERLSTDHLRECMEPTMEKTSYHLTYICPLKLSSVDPKFNRVPSWLMFNYRSKYGLLFATATILLGYYAYLKTTNSKQTFLG